MNKLMKYMTLMSPLLFMSTCSDMQKQIEEGIERGLISYDTEVMDTTVVDSTNDLEKYMIDKKFRDHNNNGRADKGDGLIIDYDFNGDGIKDVESAHIVFDVKGGKIIYSENPVFLITDLNSDGIPDELKYDDNIDGIPEYEGVYEGFNKWFRKYKAERDGTKL